MKLPIFSIIFIATAIITQNGFAQPQQQQPAQNQPYYYTGERPGNYVPQYSYNESPGYTRWSNGNGNSQANGQSKYVNDRVIPEYDNTWARRNYRLMKEKQQCQSGQCSKN